MFFLTHSSSKYFTGFDIYKTFGVFEIQYVFNSPVELILKGNISFLFAALYAGVRDQGQLRGSIAGAGWDSSSCSGLSLGWFLSLRPPLEGSSHWPLMKKLDSSNE